MDEENGTSANEFLVKLIDGNDPRILEKDFVRARQREVDGWNKQEIWNVVD